MCIIDLFSPASSIDGLKREKLTLEIVVTTSCHIFATMCHCKFRTGCSRHRAVLLGRTSKYSWRQNAFGRRRGGHPTRELWHSHQHDEPPYIAPLFPITVAVASVPLTAHSVHQPFNRTHCTRNHYTANFYGFIPGQLIFVQSFA